MYRILVVNPNTSAMATQRIVEALKGHVHSRLQVEYTQSKAGPEGIDTLLDVAVSGVEAVRTVARYRDQFDAFIIACGADPGLDAARQITRKPVVGIAEAGLLMACPLGATFSLLTGLRVEVPQVIELVRRYGLIDRLASVVPVEMATAEVTEGGDPLLQHNIAAARQAIEEDMAEVIVLAGAVVSAVAAPLNQALGVPVVSGLVAALKLAEDLLELGLSTSHRYKYHTPRKKDRMIGYEDLVDVYGN